MLKKLVFLFLVLGLVSTTLSQIIVPLSLPKEIAEGKITGWQQGEFVVVSRADAADLYQRQPATSTIKLLISDMGKKIGATTAGLFFPNRQGEALYFSAQGFWKLNYSNIQLEKLPAKGDEISFNLSGDSQSRRGKILALNGVNPSFDGREFSHLCIEQPSATPGTRSAYFTGVFERKKTTLTSIFDPGVIFEQAVPLRPEWTGNLFTSYVLVDERGRISWIDYSTMGGGTSTDDRYLVRYNPQTESTESSEILIRKTGTFLGETVRWWDLFPDFNSYEMYVRYHTPTNQQRLVKFTDDKPVLIASTDQEVAGLGKPSGINGIIPGQTIGLLGVRYAPGKNGFTILGNPEPEVIDTVLFWDPLENKLSRLFQNGDVMPDGKKVVMATRGSGFQLLASAGDCEADIMTFKDPQTADTGYRVSQTADGWYRILRACVKKSPATAIAEQEVAIEGKNFAPAGLVGTPLTEVLVDGIPVRPSSVSDTKIGVKAPSVPGDHKVQIRVAYGGRTSVSNTVTVNVVPPPPPPPTPVTVIAVTSLMGEVKPSFAQNDIFIIWGKGMSLKAQAWDGNLPLPTELGCRVILSSLTTSATASLYYCSDVQINAVVPVNIPPGRYSLVVERLASNGSPEARSQPVDIVITTISPTLLGNAGYPVYLQNITQDPSGNTFVGSETPARIGDVLVMYATGLGNTNPPLPKGMATAAKVIVSVEVLLQGRAMELLGASASPQFPGLYQIAFRVAETPQPNGESCSLEVRVDGQTVKTIPFNLAQNFAVGPSLQPPFCY